MLGKTLRPVILGLVFPPPYFNSLTKLKNLECVAWHVSLICLCLWLLSVFLCFFPYFNILFNLYPDESRYIFLL